MHPREAYDWSVESTIYCAPDARGLGVGTLLYRALLEVLDACGYWNVYALVADPNPASEHIHQRLGFSCVGRTPHTAYKWGWLGLSTWWLALRSGSERPAPIRLASPEETAAILKNTAAYNARASRFSRREALAFVRGTPSGAHAPAPSRREPSERTGGVISASAGP